MYESLVREVQEILGTVQDENDLSCIEAETRIIELFRAPNRTHRELFAMAFTIPDRGAFAGFNVFLFLLDCRGRKRELGEEDNRFLPDLMNKIFLVISSQGLIQLLQIERGVVAIRLLLTVFCRCIVKNGELPPNPQIFNFLTPLLKALSSLDEPFLAKLLGMDTEVPGDLEISYLLLYNTINVIYKLGAVRPAEEPGIHSLIEAFFALLLKIPDKNLMSLLSMVHTEHESDDRDYNILCLALILLQDDSHLLPLIKRILRLLKRNICSQDELYNLLASEVFYVNSGSREYLLLDRLFMFPKVVILLIPFFKTLPREQLVNLFLGTMERIDAGAVGMELLALLFSNDDLWKELNLADFTLLRRFHTQLLAYFSRNEITRLFIREREGPIYTSYLALALRYPQLLDDFSGITLKDVFSLQNYLDLEAILSIEPQSLIEPYIPDIFYSVRAYLTNYFLRPEVVLEVPQLPNFNSVRFLVRVLNFLFAAKQVYPDEAGTLLEQFTGFRVALHPDLKNFIANLNARHDGAAFFDLFDRLGNYPNWRAEVPLDENGNHRELELNEQHAETYAWTPSLGFLISILTPDLEVRHLERLLANNQHLSPASFRFFSEQVLVSEEDVIPPMSSAADLNPQSWFHPRRTQSTSEVALQNEQNSP